MSPTTTPSPFFFTLIAYRPDSVDTCRGQVMDRSSSDLTFETGNTPDEIAQKWAKLRFNEPQGREYAETEFTLLLNGRTADDEYALEDAEERARSNCREEVQRLLDEHLAALRAEHERALAEAIRRADEQQARAEAQRQEALEAKERAELARLQAKFGPGAGR